MKTSAIEVRDMLSVLSVLGVEKRIGAVPGVEKASQSITLRAAPQCATTNPRHVTTPLMEPTIFREAHRD